MGKISKKFAKRWLYTAVTRTTDKDNVLIVENGSKTKSTYTCDFIKKEIEGYTRQDGVKNRVCDLTVEQVRDLVERDENSCFDCGLKLNTHTMTLDRIDNSMGHSHKNLRFSLIFSARSRFPRLSGVTVSTPDSESGDPSSNLGSICILEKKVFCWGMHYVF